MIEQLDIRTGTIVDVLAFPEARKPAWKLQIDFGEEIGLKWTSAQLTRLYQADDLKGRQVIAVVNLPPKRIAGFRSECLVLGAVGPENDVVLLSLERPVPNGWKIG